MIPALDFSKNHAHMSMVFRGFPGFSGFPGAGARPYGGNDRKRYIIRESGKDVRMGSVSV